MQVNFSFSTLYSLSPNFKVFFAESLWARLFLYGDIHIGEP
jgi:hypothetical protein